MKNSNTVFTDDNVQKSFFVSEHVSKNFGIIMITIKFFRVYISLTLFSHLIIFHCQIVSSSFQMCNLSTATAASNERIEADGTV